MIVQVRRHALRLVRQHEHALVSGELAARWRDVAEARPPFPWWAVVAVSLHDAVWRREDIHPRLDHGRQAPYSFVTLPASIKEREVLSRLRLLRRLDPRVGRLVRAHHRTLASDAPPPSDLARPLAWLRFFDFFSLTLCLGGPGVVADHRPAWIPSDRLDPPGGSGIDLSWQDEDRVRLRPHPFGGEPLRLTFPYRDLPRKAYATERALHDAWARAPVQRWAVMLEP